jgi:hypothetical protein
VGVENADLRNLGERLSAKLNPSNSRFSVLSIKPPPTPSPKPRHPNQPSLEQHCPQCSPNPSAALLSRPGESSLRPSSCHSMRASPPSLAPQNHPQFPNHWSTQKQILQQQQKAPNPSHKSHFRPANQRRNPQPRQSLNHHHPQHRFPKQSKPSSLSYALNPLTILPPISMAGHTSSLRVTLSDSLSACPMFNPATHCV